ncbi:MAG: hypothetical protein K2X66_04810 [Cyanobacteria bacterium]|nr:hypothetical protein [Cyanobacteriota bacterium]
MPINNGVGSFPNPLGGPVGGASTAIGGTAGTAAVAGTTNPSLSAPGLPPPITPTGAASASQAVPAATMDANMQMVGMIAQAILMAVQSMNASGGAPAPAAPKAASAGGASSAASTPPAAGGAKTPKALVIDDFSSNDNGFQHGTEVEKTIKQGAPNATLSAVIFLAKVPPESPTPSKR